MGTTSKCRSAAAGFTLLELVVAVVLLGILTRYAMMKVVMPATMTLPTQAQSLADLVRRAQSLAMVRGQRMGVSVATSGADGRVDIACATGTMPCSTDSSFTASQGVEVGSAGTIYFNTFGMPVDNTGAARTAPAIFGLSYTTAGSTVSYNVTVAALTGRVTVGP